MATVRISRHLRRFFPAYPSPGELVDVETVAEAIKEIDRRHPGLGFYIVDEHGTLRHHVNVFVGQDLVYDKQLSDSVTTSSTIDVIPALSGGFQ